MLFLVIAGVGETVISVVVGRERFSKAKSPYESQYLALGSAAIGVGTAVGSVFGGALVGISAKLPGVTDPYRWLFCSQAVIYSLLVIGLLALPRIQQQRTPRWVEQSRR